MERTKLDDLPKKMLITPKKGNHVLVSCDGQLQWMPIEDLQQGQLPENHFPDPEERDNVVVLPYDAFDF